MNTDCPKVSIGVITYNHEAFISECLESIRAQDYPNIEVFITDDCSTDKTAEAIQAFIDRYPNVVTEVIRQKENKGMVENCNLLLEKMTGRYTLLFAGDDIMMPNKTSLQVALLERTTSASLCFSNMLWFWSDTNKAICHHFGWLQRPSTDMRDILMDFSIPTPTVMVRREMMGNLRYNPKLPFINDCLFVMEMLQRGTAVYCPEITVRYRKHQNSLTMQNYFLAERETLLSHLYQKFPVAYHASIKKYAATVLYAKAMTAIQKGHTLYALRCAFGLLPMIFWSPKWAVRVGAVVWSLMKSLLPSKGQTP